MPSTNADLWESKFERNVERDRSVRRQLEKLGWQVLVIWECDLHPRKRRRLIEKLNDFLA